MSAARRCSLPAHRATIIPNGAGGVVINQHIDARNASDPAQIAFAMKVAKNQALVEMRDMRRRGR